ncbi:hypothetical protein [Pseudoalteromonas sp. MEBiC 03485]|uniref:hypothetical protein n=1 Tax=Pseudoalteromonas sp. MEBiC 03485 TaxID=2571103 RepID=UPI001021FE6B|nr:hypothetical protein [Pseudoalteromonas sp. MEBiC 03485]RZD21689.1 hypothetical protein EVU92_06315 [Pseudoalteromonas sp. MEBiC 03485]
MNKLKIISISQSIIIKLVMNFGLFFLLAKQLELGEFVNVSFCLSLASLLLVLSEFGQRNSILVSSEMTVQASLSKAMKIFVVNSLASFLVYLIIVGVDLNGSYFTAILIFFYSFVLSFSELLAICARVTSKHKFELKFSYLSFLATALVLVFSFVFEQGVFTILYIIIFRVMLLFALIKSIGLALKMESTSYFSLIRKEFTFAIDSVASSMYGPLELTISKVFLSPLQYATFQVCQKFCQASFVLIQSLSNVYIPIISKEQKLNWVYVFVSISLGGTCSIILYFGMEFFLGLILDNVDDYKIIPFYISLYVFLRYVAAALGSHLLAFGYKGLRVFVSITLIFNYLIAITYFNPSSSNDAFVISSVIFSISVVLYFLVMVYRGFNIQNKKVY